MQFGLPKYMEKIRNTAFAFLIGTTILSGVACSEVYNKSSSTPTPMPARIDEFYDAPSLDIRINHSLIPDTDLLGKYQISKLFPMYPIVSNSSYSLDVNNDSKEDLMFFRYDYPSEMIVVLDYWNLLNNSEFYRSKADFRNVLDNRGFASSIPEIFKMQYAHRVLVKDIDSDGDADIAEIWYSHDSSAAEVFIYDYFPVGFAEHRIPLRPSDTKSNYFAYLIDRYPNGVDELVVEYDERISWRGLFRKADVYQRDQTGNFVLVEEGVSP